MSAPTGCSGWKLEVVGLVSVLVLRAPTRPPVIQGTERPDDGGNTPYYSTRSQGDRGVSPRARADRRPVVFRFFRVQDTPDSVLILTVQVVQCSPVDTEISPSTKDDDRLFFSPRGPPPLEGQFSS